MFRFRHVASLYVLCAIVFLDLTLCPSGSLAESVECKIPKSAIRWEPEPELKVVNVTWRRGNELICFTKATCFGDDKTLKMNQSIPRDGEENTHVPVQLVPVQLQKGNQLRFHFQAETNATYPAIYKVNASAFLSCHTSRGERVGQASPVEGVLEVPQRYLNFGSNYFIVAESSYVSCESGLRVNATVKRETCTGSELDSCGGRGLCITSKHQPDFSCHCCGTYKGSNCSILDMCLSYPCQNGGECLCSHNQTEGYQCKCAIGYHGDNCEHKAQNICDIVRCQNNGTCTGTATTFQCACAPGWTGTECEVDINDCEDWPCRHGDCVDKLNGYDCLCYPGYHGPDCDQRRRECTFGPCVNGGFCENQTVSDFQYACHCPPGWTGRDCSLKVSPCYPNPCANHGFCMVVDRNDFRCICEPGYGGHLCEVDMNDCDPNPCLFGGHCVDLAQGHMCRCVATHVGSNCQYTQAMYVPDFNNMDTQVVIVHDKHGSRTVTIVASVMSTLVVIGMVILAVCYCRYTESPRSFCGLRSLIHRKTTTTSSGLTVHVSVSNTADCPLTTDTFFHGSQGDLGVDNPGYKTELV